MRAVGIIGAGTIGSDLAKGIDEMSDLDIAAVLTRSGGPGQSSAREFFAMRLDLVIEAAGPTALRHHAMEILEHADLWTVSASALADEAFRSKLEKRARALGRRIRLFSDWLAATDHAIPPGSGSVSYVAIRPGIGGKPGTLFNGPLREAARLFPDHVNSAVAAALAGCGLDRATIEIVDSGPGGAHELRATAHAGAITVHTLVELPRAGAGGIHPAAAAILAALRRDRAIFRYG